jgi:predicted amidophosphoribosyltransferase
MAARRCIDCRIDWPNGSDYLRCPDCGEATDRDYEIEPDFTWDEAARRRRFAAFYREWDLGRLLCGDPSPEALGALEARQVRRAEAVGV